VSDGLVDDTPSLLANSAPQRSSTLKLTGKIVTSLPGTTFSHGTRIEFVSWPAATGGSGTVYYFMRIGSSAGNWSRWTTCGTTPQWRLNRIPKPGNHTIQIRARDITGYSNTLTRTFTFK